MDICGLLTNQTITETINHIKSTAKGKNLHWIFRERENKFPYHPYIQKIIDLPDAVFYIKKGSQKIFNENNEPIKKNELENHLKNISYEFLRKRDD